MIPGLSWHTRAMALRVLSSTSFWVGVELLCLLVSRSLGKQKPGAPSVAWNITICQFAQGWELADSTISRRLLTVTCWLDIHLEGVTAVPVVACGSLRNSAFLYDLRPATMETRCFH